MKDRAKPRSVQVVFVFDDKYLKWVVPQATFAAFLGKGAREDVTQPMPSAIYRSLFAR